MSINIQALLELFPAKGASTEGEPRYHRGIKGNIDLDARFDFGSNLQAGPDLWDFLQEIRGDTRWGPVFNGDLSAYGGDHSAADLALCGELARRGLQPPAIDIAISNSGLYRAKWERDDYRNRTIAKAMARAPVKPPVFPGEPAEPKPFSLPHNYENVSAGLLSPENGKILINLGPPKPRDWIVEGMLLQGKSAVLAGFGGTSKTQLTIQLAVSLALGKKFLGRQVKPGAVIMLLGEEDQDEITRRISALARRFVLGPNEIEAIQENVHAFPLVGEDMRITVKDGKGLKENQKLIDQLIGTAKAYGNVRLIVLDHLALVHGGDFDAREDAAITMRVVNKICKETDAALLMLAHSPKSATQKESSDASMVAGSTAFVDQSRGAWILSSMREEEAKKFKIGSEERKQYASLAIVKNNYARTGEVTWLKRVSFDETGFLEEVELVEPLSKYKTSQTLIMRILDFVRTRPGQFSKTKLRDTQSGKERGLKASKGEVEAAIEEGLQNGWLNLRAPTAEERTKFGHDARVKSVLDVGEAIGE